MDIMDKILIIDFKVRETKSYSFFIDEELCEINITRTNDKFIYTFEINKTVQTPLNAKRKKREKKHEKNNGKQGKINMW